MRRSGSTDRAWVKTCSTVSMRIIWCWGPRDLLVFLLRVLSRIPYEDISDDILPGLLGRSGFDHIKTINSAVPDDQIFLDGSRDYIELWHLPSPRGQHIICADLTKHRQGLSWCLSLQMQAWKTGDTRRAKPETTSGMQLALGPAIPFLFNCRLLEWACRVS